MDKKLDIVGFSPMADIGFWSTLAKRKLDLWRLDESEKELQMKYKVSNFSSKKSFLNLDVYSFGKLEIQLQGPVEISLSSTIKNFNTIEAFSKVDFHQHLLSLTQKQLSAIDSFIANEETTSFDSLIFEFVTFADLKKHSYSYKLCSPTVNVQSYTLTDKVLLKTTLSTVEQSTKFEAGLKEFLGAGHIAPFFFVKESTEGAYTFGNVREYIREIVKAATEKRKPTGIRGVVYDPYNQASGVSAVFTNLLALILRTFASKGLDQSLLEQAEFILIKDSLIYNFLGKTDFKNSIAITLDLSKSTIDENSYLGCDPAQLPPSIDLKSHLDEASLASEAVDLNIKLMKWRVLPTLDLDMIKSTKILMFGAGTLGCQLARNLIGWGIKHITFVDYGKISYSNPVRQSLYDFEDSTNGGKPKAPTAAEKLKKIFPDLVSEGYQLKIPMPGHYLANEEHVIETLKDVDALEELVKNHDAIYLMTDSRESRWLPTILANKFNKICITIGLGFDSFVVVRHGLSPHVHKDEVNGERLSCYFCNDVISPANTMKDRSLDQQCTVTRPGLSFVSSAYASELLISMLHHPLRQGAPGHEDANKLPTTDLGLLPQHIRGTMGEFETRIMYGRAFENCVACSHFVLDAYNNDRDAFLQRVINDPDYLQSVTLLNELMRDLEGTDAVIELDD